ncbi:MAG: RIP metalloprotease RseP [Desulfobacterales bacterium]|nr:RIP metalloprotease RseP [Desulfobacterales bacterium]
MSTSIISFVIVLGVLIFVHELGHFLVARFFGVGVEKFSLGFGPRLVGRTVGMTDYRLSAIPLGGYVKMVGDEPDTELEDWQIPYSFTHKHVFQRFLIVAAGPVFNLLLAVVIFFGVFQINGVFELKASIGKVRAGAPAELGGLRSGDEVVAIDGIPVRAWEEMAKLISRSRGESLGFTVIREGMTVTLSVRPRLDTAPNLFGEETRQYMIGISSSGETRTRRLNPLQAAGQALVQTYKITELTVVSVVKIVQGSISAKNLGGPIMIAEMAGQQAREGAMNLLFFIALISINLAILNFLPIPVLDGGHLLFFFIEMLRGRPLSIRVREIAQQAGMFLLLMLMILVFYNDITRIIAS